MRERRFGWAFSQIQAFMASAGLGVVCFKRNILWKEMVAAYTRENLWNTAEKAKDQVSVWTNCTVYIIPIPHFLHLSTLLWLQESFYFISSHIHLFPSLYFLPLLRRWLKFPQHKRWLFILMTLILHLLYFSFSA